MSCPANSLRNFSKCFTTTHIAHLTFSPSSQQLTNNTSRCDTAEGVLRHLTRHQVEIKAQGHEIYSNQGPHEAGLSDCGADTSKACSQGKRGSSFLIFYPVIPSKYYWNKQRKIWRGCSRGAFQKFQTPLKQWRKEPTGNIPSNHTKK